MTISAEAQALKGKRIVVIGGTSGLGLSAVKAFLAAGASVVSVGLDAESVESARRELGPLAHVLQGDATAPNTATEAIAEAVNTFGGFDGLYHVAGASGRRWGDGPLHEITDEGWNSTLELNLTSLFYSNRAAVRQFLAQRSPGSILNMSSVLAWAPSPKFFTTHAYTAAKSAVLGFTRSCAAYYAPQGIRFNVLAPGLIATPMSQRATHDESILAFLKTKQPLEGGRMGLPSDLDAAAIYFMSDASAFATGQVLAVDGGWSVSEGQIPAK